MFDDQALTPTGLAATPFVAVERDPARIETLWRGLERANPGRLFQRYDWAATWLATQGKARDVAPAIVLALDPQRNVAALFPFYVRGWRAVNIVEWAGSVHSTYNMPLLRDQRPLFADAVDARAFLAGAGRAIGDVDAFALTQQPRLWDGAPHPFLGVGEIAGADPAFERALGGDGEKLIAVILSSDARRKLRNKERRLGDHGALALKRADGARQTDEFATAFLEQKRLRFHKQGLHDPFAEPGFADFLRRAAAPREGGAPGVTLYAQCVDDRIIAIFGGPEDGARFSAMFTSFEDAPDVARYSPGDVLLRFLVSDLSSRGLSMFDLGVGDARYKHVYCDNIVSMFETHLALTPAGSVLAAAARAKTAVKRIIKSHPALFSLARKVLRRGGD